MLMGRLALLIVCAVSAAGVAVLPSKKASKSSSSQQFLNTIDFRRQLRICNAYPFDLPLDVHYLKGSGCPNCKKHLTEDGALAYKVCHDYYIPLKPGDKLEFSAGTTSAGFFSINGLPNNDVVLMLVIYRHDTLSTAVSFESHVFAALNQAQVATIDTFKGQSKGSLKISDPTHSEKLRYNSVVAVNPGMYTLELDDENDKRKATTALVALPRVNYVVIRVGVEAQQGTSYPEEVFVYPLSKMPSLKKLTLKNGAPRCHAWLAFPLALALATATLLY